MDVEHLCNWAISLGLATGHADTEGELLIEVGHQIAELQQRVARLAATLSKTSAEVINLTVDNQRLQLEVERLTALLQSTSHATGCPAWGVRWRDGAWEHDNRPCTCHKEQINATTKDRLHPGKHLPAREAPQHPEEARSQKGDDLQ